MASRNIEVVATFEVNGRVERLTVERNAGGTWTAGGPHECRDYATRGAAVRWLRRIYANPGVKVGWAE
jgi:hypothetical protein